MKVLILRPEELLEDTLKKFSEHGFEAYGCPFIKLRYVDFEVPEHDFVIVTSQNAARALKERGVKLRRVIAIGKKTAELIDAEEVLLPSKFDSETLYKEFAEMLRGKRVVAFRSNAGSDVIRRLAEIADFREIEVYRIEKLQGEEQKREIEKVKAGFYDAIVFSSSMIARGLLELCDEECLKALEKILIVAIGPPTAKVLAEKGIKAEIPEEYTFDGIIRLLKSKKM
ncbi:MAG: uroporphyrinogen-III synthase [Archaeoglobus sp.]|uniref:uroporphyrinogen-III synthase n=1 Tax=Archaeoglobus sp. TaxID=1872626 RepID=UPI001E1161F0|nr:uroporphyrinogen-III synthase [Archaeoglobus sp.]MBO8179904.1 uroporphyrinogen-III synthase [Archaeoglobus sp.]